MLDSFIRANEHFLALARRIHDDQWSLPAAATPDWTFQQLVEHVVENNAAIGRVLGGDERVETKVDDAPIMTLENSVQKAEQCLLAATDLQRVITNQYGVEMSVHDFILMNLTDRALHAWDLAISLGLFQEAYIEPQDAASIYDFAAPTAEQMRQIGAFGPLVEVPDDAPLADKVLGLTGRNPALASEPLIQG